MIVCYIDESGCLGKLPSRDSDIQPLFVMASLYLDAAKLQAYSSKLINLKKRFHPKLLSKTASSLDWMCAEIKGSELRKNACGGNRLRSNTFGYLDGVFQILDEMNAKIAARALIKGVGIDIASRSLYTSYIQNQCSLFQEYLGRRGDWGIIIADSRNPNLNAQVSHSIFTQKLRSSGDPVPNIIEVPVFGHSENHAGLQLADTICSGFLFAYLVHKYCSTKLTGTHIRPQYSGLVPRYELLFRKYLFRFLGHNDRWWGGLTVDDKLNHP